MRVITEKKELAIFLEAEVLPVYKKVIADGKAEDWDFLYANNFEDGICWYCHQSKDVDIYYLMESIVKSTYISPPVDYFHKTNKPLTPAITKRIKWMENFIKENK